MKYRHENSLHMKYNTVFRQFKFATNYYLGEISKKNELYCTFFRKKNETEYINFT